MWMQSRSEEKPLMLEALESRLLLHHTTPWGAIPTMVQQPQLVADYPSITGAGESIAVIDTGINYSLPQLGGGFGRHRKVVAGWNFINNNADVSDPVGHGTAVAGLIGANPYIYNGQRYQGVADGANLIALKVDDGVNNPPDSRIAQALQWVLANRTRYNIVAINLSEGNGDFYSSKSAEGTYGSLLSQLRSQGVFIACSSGNNGDSDGVEYPSADPSSISVGSVDPDGQISDFTSTGDAMDLLAPGGQIPVWWGWNLMTATGGTSFSAPWAAGLAALIRQVEPTDGVSRLLAYMQATGTAVTDPNSGQTYRRLNLESALNLAYLSFRRSQAYARLAATRANAVTATSPAATVFSTTPISADVLHDSRAVLS